MSDDLYKYKNRVDYLADLIGADVERDLIKFVLKKQETDDPLDVAINGSGNDINLDKVQGTELTAGDWTTILKNIETIYKALGSQAEDVLRITSPDPLDVSKSEIDADINSLSYSGNFPTNLKQTGGTSLTGADWVSLIQNLENLKNALKSNDTDELISRIANPSGTEIDPTNIKSISGTSLTGADWTPLFQNLDIALSVLRDAVKVYDSEFLIDQDVNSSAYSSSETEITRCRFIQYSLSGAGAFDLVINFTDGAGTTIFSKTISSADGSEISGEIKVYSKNVIVEVNDQSGSSNTVVGGVYAK